ncbi:mate-domain-containing protein [Cokeromyces recurvatus]|uniref:mate-domain-containing protein n=1 Tax=Cokeromyces recurvatus TaxID=90255 RepID=UPI002220F28E|nr:mate-domain-containing protein [Cokeromyces recurvatus]KAI7907307.1 mate-domain-containing protein [Cokeromyces recurvatus]
MPIAISYLLQNSLQSVSIITAGHLGSNELASATLGSMFTTITGLSVATGATLSLDTLCSQSFTSTNDKRVVGLHVQRCLAFMTLLYIPIVILWWYSEGFFIFILRQDPVIAQLASQYVRWMILAAPAFALFEALKKMLQAQGIFHVPTFILLLVVPFNLALNYTLVWVPGLSLGFSGAPIASCIAYWSIVGLIVFYVYYSRAHEVWPRWSIVAVYNVYQWRPMVELAIPGILLICTETWAYEIIALGASWIDTTHLGAQSIILTSITALYTLAFGVGIAAANRVGNLLGAQRPKQARTAARAALCLGIAVGSLNGLALFIFRRPWAKMFTNDDRICEIVAKTLPLVAAFVFADNIAGVADGVLNGMGRQHIGAWCNLCAYYLSALPIGFWLCFKKGWGLVGLWTALVGSMLAASIYTVVVLLCSNWKKEAQIAEKRTKEEKNEESSYGVKRSISSHSSGSNNSNNPITGMTPMQREQQKVQQNIKNNHGNGYPGVIGRTPEEFRGVQGYDQQGNPILPPSIAQRHLIEQGLGPNCPKDGGYHDLRMHLTTSSLLFAILIIPYCCGYRGRRETVCVKCNQKFPNIILP